MTTAIITAVIGIALGGIVMWAIMSNRVAELRASLNSKSAELDAEKQGRAADREANERINEEREKTTKASVSAMLEKMTNITHESLKAREQELSAQNSQQVKALMEPMRQQLEAMRKATEESTKRNGEIGLKMEGFCKGMHDTSLSFGIQAKSFTDALTGANKKQGNWGESILGQVLENCGLKEGEHYVAQTGSGSGIPDYQVFDPCSKKILIIDSKMSWTKYEQAYKMEPGAARTEALREHVASVKRHIDELKKADYPNTQQPLREGYEIIPITAMFVPCDAALSAALEEDPSLVDYANKRDVALVSPLSLFGSLLLISKSWSRYNSVKNSDEIFEQAKLMVKYVDRFFKKFEAMGKGIQEVSNAYTDILGLAATEPSGQCIKGPALKIIKLGGTPDKGVSSKTLKNTRCEGSGSETTESTALSDRVFG